VAQRWLIIVGVAAVLAGVTWKLPILVWIGGAAAAAGVALLAAIVYGAVRRSLLRRFDLSARFYVTAFAAGALGIILGTMMGAGTVDSGLSTVRLVHGHLILVGLIGLTIIGTIPTLLPTTAYSRSVSGPEAVVSWWMALAGIGAIGASLLIPELAGARTISIAAAGALILGGIVWRLGIVGATSSPSSRSRLERCG
jgi:nitrite reductase (NO-forming)